jgi:hypothetical protein
MAIFVYGNNNLSDSRKFNLELWKPFLSPEKKGLSILSSTLWGRHPSGLREMKDTQGGVERGDF